MSTTQQEELANAAANTAWRRAAAMEAKLREAKMKLDRVRELLDGECDCGWEGDPPCVFCRIKEVLK